MEGDVGAVGGPFDEGAMVRVAVNVALGDIPAKVKPEFSAKEQAKATRRPITKAAPQKDRKAA
jgi:hypothetical protein